MKYVSILFSLLLFAGFSLADSPSGLIRGAKDISQFVLNDSKLLPGLADPLCIQKMASAQNADHFLKVSLGCYMKSISYFQWRKSERPKDLYVKFEYMCDRNGLVNMPTSVTGFCELK